MGDAPVHSVAVALMLPESEVHFFDDIGYTVSTSDKQKVTYSLFTNIIVNLARTHYALPDGT
jgi:hypothetical protein